MLLNRHSIVAALLLQGSAIVAAQNSSVRVWSVFAYTLYGDSTPSALADKQPRGLSEYGASQMANVGSSFRDRYVSSSGSTNATETAIQYIGSTILNSEDVNVLSTTDQWVSASAQAFMLGLYPPLGQLNMNSTESVADGINYTAPLDGYQFPSIVTVGDGDPSSLLVAGQAKCDMYQAAKSEYQSSEDAGRIASENQALYTRLWNQDLLGAFDESSATYSNAVAIADYLEYQILHNSTARDSITDSELRQARWLAGVYTYSTNRRSESTSKSALGDISPIGGQTLATTIVEAFNMNIESFGTQKKMTLLFGDDEPAVALASLMSLASTQQSNFYSRPIRGASLIFELYSYEKDDELLPSYPEGNNLYVRFFLHNGTDSSTEFLSYSFFGYGPSHDGIPYNEFQTDVNTFAVQSSEKWCLMCNSGSIFCKGSLGDESTSKDKKGVTPAVAGVIGAFVTLAVVLLTAVISLFMCRWCKGRRSSKPNKLSKSSVGGFKGPTKLGSDTDVSFNNPIWEPSKTANTDQGDVISSSGIFVRGHERLGSWEMGQQRKENALDESHRQVSALDEPEHEWWMNSVKPVKARESV